MQVENDIPAMVVRGTGKASDLIGDIIQMTERGERAVSASQKALDKMLRYCDAQSLAMAKTEAGCFTKAIQRLDDVMKQKMSHRMDKILVNHVRDVVETYHIMEKKSFDDGTWEEAGFKAVTEALRAVKTGKVHVFDLMEEAGSEQKHADFNANLLKCLLKGLQVDEKDETARKDGIPSEEILWEKLKLTMQWDRGGKLTG